MYVFTPDSGCVRYGEGGSSGRWISCRNQVDGWINYGDGRVVQNKEEFRKEICDLQRFVACTAAVGKNWTRVWMEKKEGC